MPSGAVHASASTFLAIPAFALGFVVGDVPAAVACAAGCLIGVLVTPDLDQEGFSRTEHRIIRWTFGLGFLWLMLWYPYARLVPHRSWLSHWPVVGTLGRLLYLAPFVAAAIHFLGPPPSVDLGLAAWAIGGLSVADAAHWAMDEATGEVRGPGRPRRAGAR